jgi:hypothetical protein
MDIFGNPSDMTVHGDVAGHDVYHNAPGTDVWGNPPRDVQGNFLAAQDPHDPASDIPPSVHSDDHRPLETGLHGHADCAHVDDTAAISESAMHIEESHRLDADHSLASASTSEEHPSSPGGGTAPAQASQINGVDSAAHLEWFEFDADGHPREGPSA